MKSCFLCGTEGDWPQVCANTREAEDRAVVGDLDCLEGLAKTGRGEKGLRYVVLNFIEHMRKQREFDL